MLDRLDRASGVVRGDAVCVEMSGRPGRTNTSAVAGALLLLEIGVVMACRNDDDPVRRVGRGTEPMSSRSRSGVLLAASGEHEHVPRARRVFDRAMEAPTRRGLATSSSTEPDRLGLAAEPAEHRGVGVASIVELLDRAPDPRLEAPG